MKSRNLEISDIPECTEFLGSFHQESNMSHIPFSDVKVVTFLGGLVKSNRDTIFAKIVESEGHIIGILGATATEY